MLLGSVFSQKEYMATKATEHPQAVLDKDGLGNWNRNETASFKIPDISYCCHCCN